MLFCQWLVAVWCGLNVVLGLCTEAAGKDPPAARAVGVVIRLVLWSLILAAIYGAGAFSLIVGTR